MRYLGGKSKIRKELGEYINTRLKANQPFWEPFCGACWITQIVDKDRKFFASDIHPELIAMWQRIQKGWIPPQDVSESMYMQLKSERGLDNGFDQLALRGFVGFACSFAGRYFGGYARDKTGTNYAKNGSNSLTKVKNLLDGVEFFCSDYLQHNPLPNSLIYCDPPYESTTPYSKTRKFDHKVFWDWVRTMTLAGHTVLVSEYKAPPDFRVVWQKQTKTDMRMKDGQKELRVEKLFEWGQDGPFGPN